MLSPHVHLFNNFSPQISAMSAEGMIFLDLILESMECCYFLLFDSAFQFLVTGSEKRFKWRGVATERTS